MVTHVPYHYTQQRNYSNGRERPCQLLYPGLCVCTGSVRDTTSSDHRAFSVKGERDRYTTAVTILCGSAHDDVRPSGTYVHTSLPMACLQGLPLLSLVQRLCCCDPTLTKCTMTPVLCTGGACGNKRWTAVLSSAAPQSYHLVLDLLS